MVITLTDSGTQKGNTDDTKLYIPVPPEKIEYSSSTYFQTYSILNKGEAKIPNGSEISFIRWESFFPGEQIMDMPFVKSKKKTAKELHNQLENWKKKGTKLKLNITETPFSYYVYIDKYDATVQDAYGSIYYSLELSVAVTVSVEKVAKKKSTKNKTSGNNRSSKKSSQKKYTIQSGDTLWDIAKQFYKDGTKWKKIYNENKSTIEKAAKKHGKKSSDNGHWIYPGTVLKIP